MITLTPDESRILGVLIEKAMTVPGQYPMTTNSLATAASQKNNRDPVLSFNEERALAAVDGLRGKGLAMEVHLTGSRVIKFRHTASETLNITPPEKAVLTELLLRGPQTLGELRGRASRMHAFESIEAVQAVLDGFMHRPEPMVQRLPPAPGTRAERFAQLLSPEAHPVDAAAPGGPTPVAAAQSAARVAAAPMDDELRERVAKLENDVAQIKALLATLSKPEAT